MRTLHWLLVLTFSHLFLKPAGADTIHVAVATNFTAPMKALAAQFEHQTQHQVVLSFGSSGKIFAQIQHGAPFQLFLSADQSKPEALEKGGYVAPGDRFTYALGTLVLWSAQPGKVGTDGSVLLQGNFNKLALANPKLAPYGAAAVEVLDALQLRSSTQPKWVLGENIAQAYQFVATGNAELGLVALSQVLEDGAMTRGSGWIIPAQLHQPIRQDAVLLKRAQDHAGARALFEYLQSDPARTMIRAYGYDTDQGYHTE